KIDLSNNKDLTSLELINLPNLKHLQANNCQLTNLLITNCPNLAYLNVGNNLLTKTDFLTNLNPEKLTHLSIHSNNFSKQKLDFLNQSANLEELYLDNSNEENFDQRIYNHFYDKNYPKQADNDREKRENITFLNLNNKNLSGHLDLRDFTSLQSLSCIGNKLTNLDLSKCSNLVKLNCSGNKFTNPEFLQEIPNPSKLKRVKSGGLSLSLEFLPASCQELYCDYDYQYKSIKLADELSKEEKGASRLSQIQDPQQSQNQEWLTEGAQWVARGVAVAGGVLAATVNPVAGGVMAAASPVLEVVASQMKEKIGELGVVNSKLKELKKKVLDFLQDYDENNNQEIELEELINARVKFNNELTKLGEI
ncbi:14526_t:CDS:2, partial [Racocetra persica]